MEHTTISFNSFSSNNNNNNNNQYIPFVLNKSNSRVTVISVTSMFYMPWHIHVYEFEHGWKTTPNKNNIKSNTQKNREEKEKTNDQTQMNMKKSAHRYNRMHNRAHWHGFANGIIFNAIKTDFSLIVKLCTWPNERICFGVCNVNVAYIYITKQDT